VTIATITVCVTLSLQAVGFDVNSLLAIGGIGGLALSLAGREILENLFNGLLILSTNPFTTGDEVWFKPAPTTTVEGIVVDVGWFRTSIRSFEREVWQVPNSMFSKVVVLNVTRKGQEWRCKLQLQLTMDSEPVVQTLIEEMRKIIRADPRVIQKLHRRVFLNAIHENSLEVLVSFYIEAPNEDAARAHRENFTLTFMDIIRQCGGKLLRNAVDVSLVRVAPGKPTSEDLSFISDADLAAAPDLSKGLTRLPEYDPRAQELLAGAGREIKSKVSALPVTFGSENQQTRALGLVSVDEGLGAALGLDAGLVGRPGAPAASPARPASSPAAAATGPSPAAVPVSNGAGPPPGEVSKSQMVTALQGEAELVPPAAAPEVPEPVVETCDFLAPAPAGEEGEGEEGGEGEKEKGGEGEGRAGGERVVASESGTIVLEELAPADASGTDSYEDVASATEAAAEEAQVAPAAGLSPAVLAAAVKAAKLNGVPGGGGPSEMSEKSMREMTKIVANVEKQLIEEERGRSAFKDVEPRSN